MIDYVQGSRLVVGRSYYGVVLLSLSTGLDVEDWGMFGEVVDEYYVGFVTVERSYGSSLEKYITMVMLRFLYVLTNCCPYSAQVRRQCMYPSLMTYARASTQT